MRIPGLKSLKRSTRWLRSRFVDGVLILGYHRVAAVTADPYSICVTPQHFAEQLEVLHRYTQLLSLRELVQRLQEGKLPRRAVCLTFDDGYADNLYHAKPLLERYRIPATVFVASGYVGGEFWWDELARLLLSPATLPGRLLLSLSEASYEWLSGYNPALALEREAPNSRQGLLQSLYKRLLPLSDADRQQALAQLSAWAAVELAPSPHCRALTAHELIELARGSLVDIGAHSVTHPVLTNLPAGEQRFQILQSKMSLEKLLHQPVICFAYPNGLASPMTRALTEAAGFTCACTSFNDIVWSGSDRFHLPRFWPSDWEGAKFSRWLAKWLRA
jgi:peptidoglycan/xylan/chitin deacetylase (PgdA/CDA1 family)